MDNLLMNKVIHSIKIDEQTGCWLWLGQIANSGYGKVKIKDNNNQVRYESAAAVSYMAHIGPIPAGHIIKNTCNNRLCVNPEHLEAYLLQRSIT